ncbi:hypothetical protein [Limosilactobacillus fermentum]|uniref:hypothetical protein n=1 Tax=Limosilactobacillus fermentum TaxID=1613 RepID=UPI0023E3C1F4|nr:hypothetical protein [Limosilactobacillus fermentum]MDF4007017.1 hypothetical protein [Limosilactobacillus fermentum]MDF4015980.1 hypothetical protein [Limosilactobacillus fermentum]
MINSRNLIYTNILDLTRKFDEIVAKTGDQIGAPFCADCAQRIGAYELYQQTNQSVEALMTVLDLPWEGNALDFIGEEVTLP